MRTYTCTACEGKFLTDCLEEEAVAECEEQFGKHENEKLAPLCDTCYGEFMLWWWSKMEENAT